jgi:hypothetical protein
MRLAALLTILLLAACSHQAHDQSITDPTSIAQSTQSSQLDQIASCDSVKRGQFYTVMPDWELAQIALGRGLPSVYYQQALVKPGLCKPKGGVWTFPDSGHSFFDAQPQLYEQQHLTAQEIGQIESIKKTLPSSKRFLLRWEVWDGQLVVFEMWPTGMQAGIYSPYKVLTGKAGIDVTTGQPFALPF